MFRCLKQHSKIYIAGHQGLVGSALMRQLAGFHNIIVRTMQQLDLREQHAVNDFFLREKPEYVVVAAAKVGGIQANSTYPAEFIYDNLMISSNIIHASYRAGVTKLLYLGSSCIYPRACPQPIREEYLLTGALEQTNEPYALAKIAGLKMCESYNKQYGTRFISAMPTNLYGPHDMFDTERSHVIPALIKKFHQAKIEQQPHVTVWGTGNIRREFLFVDDVAHALLMLLDRYEDNQWINIGTGADVTIAELAHIIKRVVGFEGTIVFDATKPEGTKQKLLDVSRIKSLGWQSRIGLEDGIRMTYDWFVENVHYKSKEHLHEATT